MRRNDIEKESILKTNFVNNDFFLGRIKGFEEKYDMQWDQFLAEYSSGTLHDGRCNPDFAEWSLLCHTYMSELLKPDESPPAKEPSQDRQKPERDSGFFFEGWLCSMPKPISSLWKACWKRTGIATRFIPTA